MNKAEGREPTAMGETASSPEISEEDTYFARCNAILHTCRQSLEEFHRYVRSSHLGECEGPTDLHAVAVAIHGHRLALLALRPPQDAAPCHDKLIEALSHYCHAMERTKEFVDTSEPQHMFDAAAELQQGDDAQTEALKRLDELRATFAE